MPVVFEGFTKLPAQEPAAVSVSYADGAVRDSMATAPTTRSLTVGVPEVTVEAVLAPLLSTAALRSVLVEAEEALGVHRLLERS